MVTESSLKALACRELVSNKRRCVAIHEAAEEEFDGLEERKKARLLRIMELWCDAQRLSEEQFNGNEGREEKHGATVLLQAFKTHKNRLYGIDTQIATRRTFVIVEVDPAKKQNRADPKILRRAKTRAIDLALEIKRQEQTTGKKR